MLLVLALACSEPSPPMVGPIMGVTRLRAFRSTDLRTWSVDPDPALDHVASLGLEVGHEGQPMVTFMDMSGGGRSWWSRTFGAPSVGVLQLTETGWDRGTWSVDDALAPSLLDPQPFEGSLWYVGRDGTAGDPAAAATRVRRSPPGETVLEGLGLTDPAPVRYRGELLVFATEAREQLVLYAGEPLAIVARWPGVTVPSPIVVGDVYQLRAAAAARPGSGVHQPRAAAGLRRRVMGALVCRGGAAQLTVGGGRGTLALCPR
jgi:hypothetical protein